ncbi:MAG: ABC-F family ATP-binding cassette domain-containing protein, partial [Pseudomonadales bacterium]|nr:ABC-F family ATP-binding cassette domain-containing protein [Pseudomonadales bacterium]
MPLLRLDNLSLNYGTQVLLDQVNFTLHKGNKIGLLGRNGEGKTTLLKIIAGEIFPDSGERWLRPGVKIAWLDQSLPAADDQEVYDVVASGLAEVGELLSRYHHAIQDLEHTDMRELERVQQQLEAKDGWRMQQRVDTVLTQLQLSGDVLMKELSGGWRRRVALARALVSDPDILLLDEPTNHLDIPAIEWLEKQLQEYRGAIICITHDRAFLQQIANQIIELDRGKLYPWEGDYHSFLRYREQELAAEERANALFDKKLA